MLDLNIVDDDDRQCAWCLEVPNVVTTLEDKILKKGALACEMTLYQTNLAKDGMLF